MMSTPYHEEIRHHFDELLDRIRTGMVEMGSLVLENVRRAGEAMTQRKMELIGEVRNADREVNLRYAELEALVFETLARQQPVARDLRFLVSATRILYELERSGDLAVNCVNMLDREHGFPESPRLNALLEQLVGHSCEVFAMGIDALAALDNPAAGDDIDRADDLVDDAVSRFYAEIGLESSEIGLEAAIAMSRVGRFLERIADHAVNIGENVTYILTGEFTGDTHAVLRDEDEE